MGNTTSIKFHPWKLISNTCHTIDNIINSAIFSQKFVPHNPHWTAAAAILFLEIQWALSPPLFLDKSNCWVVLNEGHKLTARIDACAFNCSIHVLVCVWSRMSGCKWLKLSLDFNFAVWHTKPRYAKLWRHNDLIYARYYHWRFCQQI